MPVKSSKVKSPASQRGEQKSKVQAKSLKVNKKPANAKMQKKKETQKPKIRSLVKSSKTGERVSARLRVEVLDVKGKPAGNVTLPNELFGVNINKQLMASAVRVYLANQRQGTVSTKTRGEVRGSTRKIYRQKGTGKARHGGIRAPLFVKGGIAFGPKPRDFSLTLTKKMREAALFSALSSKLEDNAIKILSGLEKIQPKTKEMALVLKNIGVVPEKKVLLVIPERLDNVWKSARNIQGIRVAEARQLNTYDVLHNNAIVFVQPSIEVLKKSLR